MKKERPSSLSGKTFKMKTGCGNLYITINISSEDHLPFELFLHAGKSGGCVSAQCESIGRLVTYILRMGEPTENVIKELQGISCQYSDTKIFSCADAIAQVLKQFIEQEKDET